MAEKRAQSLLLVDANHDLAKNDSRNVLRVCCLNFHAFQIAPCAREILSIKFLECHFKKNLASSCSKMSKFTVNRSNDSRDKCQYRHK